MPRLTWTELRRRISWENHPEQLLGPLVTGENADGTPFTLPISGTVNAQNPIQDAIALGQAYVAGLQVSLSSGQLGQLVLINPAGSGRVLQLIGHQVYTDQATMRVRYLAGATASGGAAVTPYNANPASGQSSAATIRGGVAIASGHTYIPAEARVGTGSHIDSNWSLILPPGLSFGIEVTAPSGLGANAIITANAYWVETAL